MKIELQNLIPKNLQLELASTQGDLRAFLREEGVDELVDPFFKRVADERRDQDETWIMWEGYFANQTDGTQNLYAVGVLQMDRMFYTRLMRVKAVPPDQVEETQAHLGIMIIDYMEGLAKELARTVKPGTGKTSQIPGSWSRVNGKEEG